MTKEFPVTAPRSARLAGLALVLCGLAACGLAPIPSGTNDPYEAVNREWFDTNLALSGMFSRDTAPVDAGAAGSDADTADSSPEAAETPVAAPRSAPLRRMVGNFGANLGVPSSILNDLLQIRPDRAVENTIRLVVNTTLGLGGLFDPAGAMGIHGRRSDFGETLHRWGVGEGAYMVLPVLGPTTERDAAGQIVDAALNPLRFVLTPTELRWSTAARLAGRFAESAEYSDILDANVINTADPYAQARLLYLQTRRYHLGIENEDEVIDPYADFLD
jgi:phospholipid-binding lipoprotein MlaA